ncbi:MAG TPA: DUF4012 domain-containing protein [Anaerolineales bacterium]|nr:DUF4012 domain-containing protein [Anaerolineales bacterium]
MVNVSPESIEDLKYILENSLHPERLDSHPWTSSPIVQEVDGSERPGQRLVLAISGLFSQMMPSTPMKRGKRLDSRWAEFGILAALYFAPVRFGAPSPASLRDAWGRIDQSILYFVYGKSQSELSKDEVETYKLVGDEPEVASISTLSDWHRKGLQRLAERIQVRENYLAKSVPEVKTSSATANSKKSSRSRASKGWRVAILFLAMLLLGSLAIAGLKVRDAYELALIVRRDAQNLQTVMKKDTSRLERIREAGPALSTLRQDFNALKSEVEPYLWIGPWLGRVPVYGGDLTAAQDLVTLADSLLATAETSYQVVLPVAEENEQTGFDLPRLTDELLQAQPQLSEARRTLELALAARDRLAPETLTPELRDLVNDLDRLLPLLEDGLTVGLELPRLLGATDEGPRTYLLLVQNEDELRPTGGFITAAGTLLLEDGKITGLEFSNSDTPDDWTKPYPSAPWQLQEYMNSPVLIFRDANWFVDYPTAARYAEHLYSYSSNHSVDGVIAFDQQALVEVLRITGPIQLEDVDYPIDAGNVISYMRAAKTPTPEESASPEWNNKAFINKITRALLGKIFSGDVDLEQLATLFVKVLNERHVLLQVDNPVVTSVLKKYHWDGAIHPSEGDFLMVVDTNVGFNKTNAVVESKQVYEVDLTQMMSPKASLMVVHTNKAVGVSECKHWEKSRAEEEKDYPIQDCYWNYLRVFTPKGTFLLDATPQSIPADWMILEKSPPARVDILDEEIEGVQGFGTMQVVPASNFQVTFFEFLLPTDVIQPGPENGQWLYRLKVQKQPGTLAVPITIRIRLPGNASVIQAPAGAVVEGTNILLETNLRVDLEIEVLYQIP